MLHEHAFDGCRSLDTTLDAHNNSLFLTQFTTSVNSDSIPDERHDLSQITTILSSELSLGPRTILSNADAVYVVVEVSFDRL